jgi:hypothetical protein
MIQVAAKDQSCPELIDPGFEERFSSSSHGETTALVPGANIAFFGFAVWRREENGDANLSDEHVFVVRDGKARFLKPRNDVVNHSPDGLSWGYAGSGAAQLAAAMLMEIFDDWRRVQPLYQRFKEHFVAKIPQHTNWTADGEDIAIMAMAIERQQKSTSRN